MMKTLFVALTVLLLAGIVGRGFSSSQRMEYIYVGTFTGQGSEGLYTYAFDRSSGTMTRLQAIDRWESPNFQAVHPDGRYLYSVASEAFSEESEAGTIVAYRIDEDTGTLSEISAGSTAGAGPAHVSVDPLGRFVYVSNYRAGNVSVFRIHDDGSLSSPVDVVQHEGSSVNERRQEAPHVHSAVPSRDGRFLYVSDLGIDKVMIYRVDPDSGELQEAEMPYVENTAGAGPRHLTIHPNNDYAYSLEEMSSTVMVLRVDSSTGGLHRIQRVDMLPEEYDGDNTGADLHISPDGRFLYASNRGHNSLVIYRIDRETGQLSVVEHQPTRGPHPRNFMMDEQGEYVLVANRDENEVVVFRRDRDTGRLTYSGETVTVPRAVCVTQHVIP